MFSTEERQRRLIFTWDMRRLASLYALRALPIRMNQFSLDPKAPGGSMVVYQRSQKSN